MTRNRCTKLKNDSEVVSAGQTKNEFQKNSEVWGGGNRNTKPQTNLDIRSHNVYFATLY